jgi:hypothetical protein
MHAYAVQDLSYPHPGHAHAAKCTTGVRGERHTGKRADGNDHIMSIRCARHSGSLKVNCLLTAIALHRLSSDDNVESGPMCTARATRPVTDCRKKCSKKQNAWAFRGSNSRPFDDSHRSASVERSTD